MGTDLLFIILLVLISRTTSSWSSSINSIFTARNVKSVESFGTNKDLMESAGHGVQMALEHCQAKFKWNRWNCPESAISRHSHQPLTRESAFVSAIISAGMVHAITKNCSRGELSGCGCEADYAGSDQAQLSNKAQSWMWGGCSNHLIFGEQVARNVLNDLEKGHDQHAKANLHNNFAGILIVRATMQKRCRCHGVSGSCTMQTCWMQTAPFKEITSELRVKYEKAHKIQGPMFNIINQLNVVIGSPAEDLVYLVDSPDYCKKDVTAGWNGTRGRACSRNRGETITPAERKSCKSLCRTCGLRVRRERRRLTRRCNCSFHWCCEVKCDTCSEYVDEFFCE